MEYAIYLLKAKRIRIKKAIRDYKNALNNGEYLNHVLDVEAYEKHIKDLDEAIEKLES